MQVQKKPQRNTYRGFFPMSTGLGQALRDPSHRKHTTQEDASKVAKSPSCRTTAWMSAIDAVDGSIHRHIGAMAVGCG